MVCSELGLEGRKRWRGGRVGEEEGVPCTQPHLGSSQWVPSQPVRATGQKTPGTKAHNPTLGSLWGHLSRTELAGLGAERGSRGSQQRGRAGAPAKAAPFVAPRDVTQVPSLV